MENLKLPSILNLIWEVQRAIEKNQTFQIGIERYLASEYQDPFAIQFKNWVVNHSESTGFACLHRGLIDILRSGYQGQPIYDRLKQIEADYIEICMDDIAAHTAKVPLIMQIPLIFLIFPAVCLLLLVPTLSLLQL